MTSPPPLEEKIDPVSAGELDYKHVSGDFWKDFHAAVGEIGDLRVSQVLDALNDALGPVIFPPREDGTDPRVCPTCGTGRLSLKTSRYGAFIGCSNYPECRFTRPIATPEGEGSAWPPAATANWALDPQTSEKVWLRRPVRPLCATGRRRQAQALVPAQGVDCGLASTSTRPLRLLSPWGHARGWACRRMTVSRILAGLGKVRALRAARQDLRQPRQHRFGVRGRAEPRHNPHRRKSAGGPARPPGAARAAPLKELGEHPPDRQAGAHSVWAAWAPTSSIEDVNANVPRGFDPQAVTLEEAVALLAERAAKGGGKKPARRTAAKAAPKAAKPAAEKKAPAKKPAAKKAPLRQKGYLWVP